MPFKANAACRHHISKPRYRVLDLREFNMAQLALFTAHAGPLEVPVHDGIPCYVTEKPDQIPPFMLTTEYPDETIYGDAFRLAHAAQCAAVLEAASLLADGRLTPSQG